MSAFDDKTAPPSDRALAAVLGRTSTLWTRLKNDLQAAHGPLIEEWSFSGKAYGWGFRLKKDKRRIVYMTPYQGYFLASFALGEKACREAHARRLSAPVLALIDAAPKYAEGRGIRIPVKSIRDLNNVKALAAVKVEN